MNDKTAGRGGERHSTRLANALGFAALERELGVKLFDRDPREVKLTPDGLFAFDRAEGVVRVARRLSGKGEYSQTA